MNNHTDHNASLTPRWSLDRRLAIALLVLVPLAIWGHNIYDGLSVGVASPPALPEELNQVGSPTSVMIGTSNHGTTPKSLAVGSANNLGATPTGSGSFAAGHYNNVNGFQVSALGHANTVGGQFNGAIGYGNQVQGFSSFGWGQGNYILPGTSHATAAGHYNIIYAVGGAGIGVNNDVYSYGCTSVGTFNAPVNDEDDAQATPSPKTHWRAGDPVFVVGNGSGAGPTPRSNALVVLKDGTVIIPKRQGDISMGAFTTQ
jgi:hypothetical protein